MKQYYIDVANSTLPSFAFIEPGYGLNDEHPGSFQPIWLGQIAVSNVINALMASPSWNDSVFFFSYDEGGGPYDHVPPIPGHSNDYTDKSMGTLPDISSISVSPDSYGPCLPPGDSSTTPEPPTNHCDLRLTDPGAVSTDVAAVDGFGAQIGFRVPNMIVSPFTRRHYVSHIPMDHTAVIKFVENRFITPTNASYGSRRGAAEPAGLFRLQQCPLVHASHTAGSVLGSAWDQLLQPGDNGELLGRAQTGGSRLAIKPGTPTFSGYGRLVASNSPAIFSTKALSL